MSYFKVSLLNKRLLPHCSFIIVALKMHFFPDTKNDCDYNIAKNNCDYYFGHAAIVNIIISSYRACTADHCT